MKIMQQAPTTFTTDADGQRLAHVALANTNQRATLYAEDLDRLLAAGWSPYSHCYETNGRHRYVLVRAYTPDGKRGRTMTVARLVADAGKQQRVVYIDGDRANLRRENLCITSDSRRTQTPACAALPRHPGRLQGTAEGGAWGTPGAPRASRAAPADPACFATDFRDGI